jgi:NAD(P)-dependent dehydrogenase (short-subunit alcohol dehydrogenase family)
MNLSEVALVTGASRGLGSRVAGGLLEDFSNGVALEVGPHGVTSNCICPVFVRTSLVENPFTNQARNHGISRTR